MTEEVKTEVVNQDADASVIENDEQAKLNGELELPDLTVVLVAIDQGKYDNNFALIEEQMQKRRTARQEEVLAQVHEVFGEDAEITLPEEETPLNKLFKKTGEEKSEIEKPNPFFRRAQTQQEPQVEEESEPGDALDSMNELENKMITEGSAQEVPIESRGAIISGLSSSDIEG